MRFNGLKIEVIVAVFVALTTLVFSAQWLVDHYQVERPLLEAAGRVDGVQAVQLLSEGGRMDLVVTMGKAKDFRLSYRELVRLLDAAYGPAAGRVSVRDSRNERLERAYYEMHFDLQEALSTGRYSELRRATEEKAQALKVSPPRIWVEDGRIYLTLSDRNQVLYEVIERAPVGPATNPEEGGGSVG